MNSNENRMPVPLTDKNLDHVVGGRGRSIYNGKYYVYDGRSVDVINKYVCPHCGAPLQAADWPFTMYKCYFCNESWYFEDKLVPDLNNSKWREVSKEEYDRHS